MEVCRAEDLPRATRGPYWSAKISTLAVGQAIRFEGLNDGQISSIRCACTRLTNEKQAGIFRCKTVAPGTMEVRRVV